MEEKIYLKNALNENIDVLIEGNNNSEITVVFVHGFGTDKNEGSNYFIEVSDSLKNKYRIVRFDFSGYGGSEGKEEEVTYEKQAKDLDVILQYVKKRFRGKIFLYAHSMGCFVTLLLNPDGIERTILTSIPNSKSEYVSDLFQKWIMSKKGGKVNKNGLTIFPRSTGKTQKIGKSFWDILEGFDPLKSINKFARKSKVLIIHANQDQIIGKNFVKEYTAVPGVQDVWIDGDHNYTNPEDRRQLIKKVINFYA